MKFKKLAIFAAAAVMTVGAMGLISACGGDDDDSSSGVYTITVEYTSDNKDDIPSDAVNQVMFAYSDTEATFNTELTLDSDTMTYTLYKQIITDEDEDLEDVVFNGQWYFYGSYTVDSDDSDSITLEKPDSGQNSIYYPTVLNYNSIETQTQGWVDSTEDVSLLTRFNKWYPSKASTYVDQPVTLSGSTMTFGDVDLDADTSDDSSDEDSTSTDDTDTDSDLTWDEDAIIGAVSDGKVISLYSDGTFMFEYSTYSIVEYGTWTWENYTLTVTTAGGNVSVAEFNSDYNLEFTYVTDASSYITATFVLEDWGDALGTGGTYTVS